MGDYEGKCVRFGRADMIEVDVLVIDPGGELGKAVEPRFGGAPVELVAPEGAQFVEIGEFGSVVPTRPIELIRQPCALQAQLEVRDDLVGYVAMEWGERRVHRSSQCHGTPRFGPSATAGSVGVTRTRMLLVSICITTIA